VGCWFHLTVTAEEKERKKRSEGHAWGHVCLLVKEIQKMG